MAGGRVGGPPVAVQSVVSGGGRRWEAGRLRRVHGWSFRRRVGSTRGHGPGVSQSQPRGDGAPVLLEQEARPWAIGTKKNGQDGRWV